MKVLFICLLFVLVSCGSSQNIETQEPTLGNESASIRVKMRDWPISFEPPSDLRFPLDVSEHFHILAFGKQNQKGPKAYILVRAPYFNGNGKPQIPVPSAQDALLELKKSVPPGGELIESKLVKVDGYLAARLSIKSDMQGKKVWMVILMVPINKEVSYQVTMMTEKERYDETLKAFNNLVESIKFRNNLLEAAVAAEVRRSKSR